MIFQNIKNYLDSISTSISASSKKLHTIAMRIVVYSGIVAAIIVWIASRWLGANLDYGDFIGSLISNKDQQQSAESVLRCGSELQLMQQTPSIFPHNAIR